MIFKLFWPFIFFYISKASRKKMEVSWLIVYLISSYQMDATECRLGKRCPTDNIMWCFHHTDTIAPSILKGIDNSRI